MKMFSGLMPNFSAFWRAGSSSSPLAQVGGEGHHFALVGVLQHFRMTEVSRPPE